MTDDENPNREEQDEPKTQTEAAGGPPPPPRKTALGYSSSGGDKWPSFAKTETREWCLDRAVSQRSAGIPWREIDLERLQRYQISRQEVDAEVRRRGGKTAEEAE